VFYSIQSEGFNSGRATVFIKLFNPNLAYNRKHYNILSTKDIVDSCIEKQSKKNEIKCDFVQILGGDTTPLRDLYCLVTCLRHRGFKYIALETDGADDLLTGIFDWVTITPDSNNNFYIHKKNNPNEIKYIVNEYFTPVVIRNSKCGLIYLQPEIGNRESFRKAVRIVKENPKWMLSLKTRI